LREVEPLREVPENMKVQDEIYQTLRDTFKK
jgi:phenylacetic acid degradation protein